ncbi:hypothetical protein N2152v2_007963 [Parachlorella kessleri]
MRLIVGEVLRKTCVVLGLTLVLHSASRSSAASDEDILLAFKASIENWDAVFTSRGLLGWDSCTAGKCLPLCSWSGVGCSPFESGYTDRVTDLQLPCDGCPAPAVGHLAPELAQLEYLQTLNLRGNAFYGELPDEWGDNGTFPSLTRLNLNSNNLTGTLPESWATGFAFLKLAELHLANNQLSGPISYAWATTNTSFVELMVWNLASNRLTGTLPQIVNGIIGMSAVAFQNNLFTGTLPPHWGHQGWYWNNTYNATQELYELYLHDNLLTGSLPDHWGSPDSFTQLRTLSVGGNPFNTTLPADWGNQGGWPMLTTLNMSYGGLYGPLPDAWGEGMPSLQTLSLDGNNLSGTVPSSWASLPSLQQIYTHPGASAGGNPRFCNLPPGGANWVLCSSTEKVCDEKFENLNSTACTARPVPPASSSSSLSPGVIAGIAVGAAVGAALAAAAVVRGCVVWRRHRRRRQALLPGVLPPKPESAGDGYSSLDGTGRLDGFRPPTTASAFHAEGSLRNGPKDGPMRFIGTAFGDLEVRDSAKAPGDEATANGSLARAASGQAQAEHQNGFFSRAEMSWSPSLRVTAQGSHNLQPAPIAGSAAGSGRSGGNLSGGSARGAAEAAAAAAAAEEGPSALRSQMGSELESFMNDWYIAPDEIEILKRQDGSSWELGCGAFGRVYKATRNAVQPVAVKVLLGGSQELGCRQHEVEFQHELAVLRACRDANIVQFQGVCITSDGAMLVTEYMEGGSLWKNIRSKRVSWYSRGKRIAIEVARGLAYLHSRRVVHFDVKSANVLISGDGVAKLADFGMSRLMAAREYITGNVGTLAWSAPEVLWGQKCTTKADIYAFGVVLWEIVTGEQPVRGRLRDVRVPCECPSEVRDVILRCLEPNPADRPTAVQLIEWLQQAPDHTLGPAQPQELASGVDSPGPAEAPQPSLDSGWAASATPASQGAAAGTSAAAAQQQLGRAVQADQPPLEQQAAPGGNGEKAVLQSVGPPAAGLQQRPMLAPPPRLPSPFDAAQAPSFPMIPFSGLLAGAASAVAGPLQQQQQQQQQLEVVQAQACWEEGQQQQQQSQGAQQQQQRES